MTVTIGLTGSIATGKSTVATMLKELQIPVIDADKIAREVVEPGEEAYDNIVVTFGEGILKEDQSVNRKRLGSIVFSDKNKREQLNQIVHPAVRKRMLELKEKFVRDGEELVVLDVPLLFESKLTYLVDQIIVVSTDEETQLKRLMKRDHSSQQQAQQRIDSQMTVKDKVKKADYVIDNSGSIESTKQQLLQVLGQIQ